MFYNGGENTPAQYNPFRYRGYYYDTDLGLYYLNSRYYDAAVGRFISADDIGVITATPMGLTDKNLYAYCDNNPVMRVDGGGEFWNVVIGAVVGAAIGLVTSVVSEVFEGNFEPKDLGQIFVSTAIGAAEGALTALAPGASVAISAVAGIAETAINGAIAGDDFKTVVVDSAISGVMGAAMGAGGADFVKGGKLINEAANASKNILRKGVHPVVKKASKKILRKAGRVVYKSLRSGVIEDLAYGCVNKFLSEYAKLV